MILKCKHLLTFGNFHMSSLIYLISGVMNFTTKTLRRDMVNKRKFLMLLVVCLVVISTVATVFSQSDSIKTHEYNFLNKAYFNISDDLTNESEFKLSPFDSLEVGTYYEYPDQKVTCSLFFVGADGITNFEGHQENSSYEKIDGNTTSQDIRHISSRIPMNMMCSLI